MSDDACFVHGSLGITILLTDYMNGLLFLLQCMWILIAWLGVV